MSLLKKVDVYCDFRNNDLGIVYNEYIENLRYMKNINMIFKGKKMRNLI